MVRLWFTYAPPPYDTSTLYICTYDFLPHTPSLFHPVLHILYFPTQLLTHRPDFILSYTDPATADTRVLEALASVPAGRSEWVIGLLRSRLESVRIKAVRLVVELLSSDKVGRCVQVKL